MRIGLHDAEKEHFKHKTFPNLALMKISAYHKRKGDQVEWWNPLYRYDRMYSSKVFDFTPIDPYLSDDAIRGGTGYRDISFIYVKDMMMELLDFLERQGKELDQEKPESAPELPAKVQRLYDSAVEMQAKVRANPMLVKVYSDVHFGKLIEDIEEYREQLRTARKLFS